MTPPEISGPANARRAERKTLYALAGIQFTYILDFMIVMPLGPVFTRALDISVQQFGWIIAAYTFSAAIAGILAANFIDHFGRRRLLLGLYGVFALATLLCALAPGYWSLVLARCLAGAFGGLLSAMIQVCVGELIPFERRGRAMGLIMSSFSIASVAGMPLGLLLAANFGFRAPFLFITLLSAAILTFALRVLPDAQPQKQTRVPGAPHRSWMAPMGEVLREPNHLRAFTFMALLIFSGVLLFPYLPLHLTTNTGMTEAQLPLMYLIGGLMTLFSARFVGKLADKRGKIRVYRWAALATLAPVLVLTHIGVVPLGVVLVITTFLFVLMTSRTIPGMALITGSAVPSMRGAFMSMNATVQSIATGVAVLVGGAILSQVPGGPLENFDILGYIMVAVTLAAVWLAGKLKVMPDAPDASEDGRTGVG